MIDFTSLPRLNVEEVPAADKGWVEKAVVAPFNRVMAPIYSALQRLPIGQLNAQVLEWRGHPPSSTAPADFVSTLTGKCIGVSTPIYAMLLQSGSEVPVPMGEAGGLAMPQWVELKVEGRQRIRITLQPGSLTSTSLYVLRWIAYGT